MTATRPPFAPWDRRELPSLLSEAEASARGAAMAATERRLADVLERAAAASDGHAQATLERHAANHRWHESLWLERLAVQGSGDDRLPAGIAAVLDEVGRPAGSDEVAFLAGVYRVLLPRLAAAVTFHSRALGSEGEAQGGKWFELILKDLFDEVRDGELLLESVLSGEQEVQAAADRRAALEKQIVAAGGLAGPGTLGTTNATTTEEVTAR